MPKLTTTSPTPTKHTSLYFHERKIAELVDRAEALTGLRTSQSVLVRRGLCLLEAHFDQLEAQLGEGRYTERAALRDAAAAR